MSFRCVETVQKDENPNQKEINIPTGFQEIQNNLKQQEDYHEESTFHFLKDQNSLNKHIQDPNDSLISSPFDISNICQNIDDLQDNQSPRVHKEEIKKDEDINPKPSPIEDIKLEINKDPERGRDNVHIEKRVIKNKTRAEHLARKSTTFQEWFYISIQAFNAFEGAYKRKNRNIKAR